VSADLTDLQANITGLLRAELNRSEACGERIDIQRATLTPMEPASLLTTELHYERWACVKALGKQIVKKLVSGNGRVKLTLTPVIEQNKTVKLAPQVATIEADGSLGELLRSGSIGEMLREKIRTALVSAIQKGTNFQATLPPAIQDLATVKDARFRDAGSGRLAILLTGEVRISSQQLQALSSQLKEHVSSR
jgi:hypothetical protein